MEHYLTICGRPSGRPFFVTQSDGFVIPGGGFVTPGDGFVILSIVFVILSEAKDLYNSSSAGPNDK